MVYSISLGIERSKLVLSLPTMSIIFSSPVIIDVLAGLFFSSHVYDPFPMDVHALLPPFLIFVISLLSLHVVMFPGSCIHVTSSPIDERQLETLPLDVTQFKI